MPPEWTGFWEGIRRGIERPRVEAAARTRPGWRWRPGFAIGAVAALVLVVSVALWQVPRGPLMSGTDAAISVTSAVTDRPDATVMVYTPPERDLAVVWLFD